MISSIHRRTFLTALGAAAAWPLAARAQQPLPVVGFLNTSDPQGYAPQLAAFLKGLREAGYVDGHNVTIEYRWAEGQIDRLPAMVADLIHRHVAVLAATSTPAALAAKASATTIPVVFEMGGDPVQLGFVPNLNRPGGNVTGVTSLDVEVTPKRLELLHELLPDARVVALLVNPADTANADVQTRMLQAAVLSLGLELHVVNASTERDFDTVFANLIQLRVGGLVIGGGPFLISRQQQLAALAVRHAIPAIFEGREFVAAGGLAGYGGSIADAYHLAGVYVARILKGEKPGELPVQQSTKVELILNLKTAKALGITFPLTLLGRADEVIE